MNTQNTDTPEAALNDMCDVLEEQERSVEDHLETFAGSLEVRAVLELQGYVIREALSDAAHYTELGEIGPGAVEEIKLRMKQLELLGPIVTACMAAYTKSLEQQAAPTGN